MTILENGGSDRSGPPSLFALTTGASMGPDPTDNRDIASSIGLPTPDAEEELRHIRKKYDDLCRQMDETLAETMERSNRFLMEAEISSLIMGQVFNASNDGIWAVDKNYRVIRVNKRLLDFLGLPANEVVGSRCYDMFMGLCRSQDGCPMERIKEGDQMLEQEKSLAFRSGDTIPFMITSTPLCGLEQNTIGLVETFKDITEQKNSERRLQQANRELERLATEDGLTKLFNRRHFDRSLDTEWRRQARAKRSIALVMCDVDFFKKYNDQYGHQAGDACLQAVAESIRRRVRRPGDLTARYGGEEFTIILPDTDLEGARHIAEAICQELTLMRIAHDRSSVAPIVTISCGIACMFPSTDTRPQMLIERADQALYRAKQEGRNRVVSFEEPAANLARSLSEY